METDWVEVYSIGEPSNAPPTVDVGIDRTVTLPNPLALSATIVEDGRPLGGAAALTWSQVSGPGAASLPGERHSDPRNSRAYFMRASTGFDLSPALLTTMI